MPGRAFTGLEHVWRTDDHGGSRHFLEANGCSIAALDPTRTEPCGDWAEMGANLTSNSFGSSRSGQFVVAIARAPSDTGTLWAATRTGRLFVTKNADESQPGTVVFRRIDTPSTPGRFVSGIAVDPGDPNRAWVSYSGYNAYTPSTTGHVFEVRYDPATYSASFNDLSSNLGDQPITGIAEDGKTCDLYAATDFGVLKLPSGSSAWVDSGTGLPTAAVYGLSLAQSGRVLYAATHGRGAYALSLPSTDSCPPPSPAPTPSSNPTNPTPKPNPGTAKASLKRIGAVKLGHKTTIRGSASADGGVASVTLNFGDGRSRTLKLGQDGAFKVSYRYRKAKTFKVKLSVAGRGGESARTSRNTHVKPKHKKP